MKTEDLVDVLPLQEKLVEAEARGIETSEICYKLGWVNSSGYGDTSKLKRTVGLMRNRKDIPPATVMPYEVAVKICRALGVDPHEVNV
jgi:hypothetical protein